jgi:TetR/AcrR family transcriptional regulator
VRTALNPWNEEYFRVFELLFARASQDHGNMVGRQTHYALSFMGTLHAWASIILSRQMKPQKDEVHRIVHFFMHGIFS